jgi:ADP-L-glycero-D-manno-heptose 6-epimerase
LSNLSSVPISGYHNRTDFIKALDSGAIKISSEDVVIHLGACSATTERDLEFLLGNNYNYSKKLMHHAVQSGAKFIYASSASVYGTGANGFSEKSQLNPMNGYGYSKYLFDCYVEKFLKLHPESQIYGLRFFNVYGPNEEHKGTMRSVIRQFWDQAKIDQKIHLFGAYQGCAAGEQKRDFIHVDDCVDQLIFFIKNGVSPGVYNCGSGDAKSFNEVAQLFKAWFLDNMKSQIDIYYIDFPASLKGSYQSYTCADLEKCKQNSIYLPCIGLDDGLPAYMNWLKENANQDS